MPEIESSEILSHSVSAMWPLQAAAVLLHGCNLLIWCIQTTGNLFKPNPLPKIVKIQNKKKGKTDVFQTQLSPSLPSPVDEVLQLSVQVLDGKPQIERDYTLRQRLKSRCPRRPRCPRPKTWLRKEMSQPVTAINLVLNCTILPTMHLNLRHWLLHSFLSLLPKI